MVNIKASSSALTPLEATAHALVPYPTPVLEDSAPVLEVDHFMDVTATLMVKEPTSPSTSTKRAQNEEQQCHMTECSSKLKSMRMML